MRRRDLIDPQTKEQEAENAVYIARVCKRLRAKRSGFEATPNVGEALRNPAHYPDIRARALSALQRRLAMKRRLMARKTSADRAD